MPPIRDHDLVFEDVDVDDDDGMPPLVDNPNPGMNLTFLTDMHPVTFTSEPRSYEVSPEASSITSSPPESPITDDSMFLAPTPRASHGKKRDASYIPRPPNAFILFRSSFIRSQQVPGKVEGNHSTLSKIIGMYWKTLPREEREQWEAKAVVAQAEHRKKYPDWRFRPGANAMAKLKVKDGTGTSKQRGGHSRKGKEKLGGKEKIKETRCAKIADLLVEGKKGQDLEAAVKEWEGDRLYKRDKAGCEGQNGDNQEKLDEGSSEGTETTMKGKEGGYWKDSGRKGKLENMPISDSYPGSTISVEWTDQVDLGPDEELDARFKVPLTSMFRRSLSAPAPQVRDGVVSVSRPIYNASVRRQSAIPMMPIDYTQSSPALSHGRNDEGGSPGQHPVTIPTDFAMPPSSYVGGESMRWLNDGFINYSPLVQTPLSVPRTDPGYPYDINTSEASPSTLTEIYSVQVPNHTRGGEQRPMTYSVYRREPRLVHSSYSTLEGWAGDAVPSRDGSGSEGEMSPLNVVSPPPAESLANKKRRSDSSPEAETTDDFGWYDGGDYHSSTATKRPLSYPEELRYLQSGTSVADSFQHASDNNPRGTTPFGFLFPGGSL